MGDDELPSEIQMANAYAVIIGIGQYKDPTIPPLKYTHVDAEDLYDLLINPRRIGIQKENIKLLLNEEATLQNIKSTVGTWLLRKADEDSTVIVFFSGHGGVEPEPSGTQGKYLLPWDARRDDLYATAISSRDFEGLLQRIKSNRLVMFLDACHSGGVISREGTKDVVTVENLCADLAAGSGRAIIAASQGNQQSFEDDKLGHGIFAHHLLEALKGKADTDRDGKATLTETFNYLGREVPKTARELAGAVQEPMMRSDLTKDIVLAVDLDRLEEIRKEKEQAEQEAKTREDKGKLLRWWSEHKISTEQYDNALKVYEADDALLDEQDRRIKELTHELLAEKLAIENYVFSINMILGTAEKLAAEKTAEKAAIEETIAEEARKTQEAAERKAREEAEAKEEARREVKKKPAQAEKPAPVIKKLVRKGWFRAVVSVLLIVGIGFLTLYLLGRPSPPTPAPPPVAITYTLAVYLQGQGTVILNPPGGRYSSGTRVALTATPAPGWEFSGWTGDFISVKNPITIGVYSNEHIIATFVEQASPTVVTFRDVNLEAAIHEAIGKPTGEIYQSDLEELTFFSAQFKRISDFTGLEYCSKLSSLDLGNNQISDISPLSSLTSLTHLWLYTNQISDISPLSSLTNLTLLEIHVNQISDVSPLSSLNRLTRLDLASNQISDISPLDSLTSLKMLALADNQISDISPLSSLTSLTDLWLYQNQISDISPLVDNVGLDSGDRVSFEGNPLSSKSLNDYIPQLEARGIEVTFIPPTTSPIIVTFPDANLEAAIRSDIGKTAGDITTSDLKDLTKLTAEKKGIIDLTSLQYCTSLRYVALWDNQITNILPLASLTSLTILEIWKNQISDISPLASLTNLQSVQIAHNQISNLSPLASLTSLTSLGLGSNQITDTSPLASLTSLTNLDIGFNQINNISALSSLTNLKWLGLWGNQITDTSPLASLTKLTSLWLGGNSISNISPLASLTNLTALNLQGNQIKDISPLASLTGLTTLYLDNNQISDISPLLENSGLGAGDKVDFRYNPLSETSKNTYIPQLKARGVEVTY